MRRPKKECKTKERQKGIRVQKNKDQPREKDLTSGKSMYSTSRPTNKPML